MVAFAQNTSAVNLALFPQPRTNAHADEPAGAAAPIFAADAIDTYFCGSVELFRACRDLFLKQSCLRLRDMQLAHAAGDVAQLRHHAHTLKGSAATLGAQALALACQELEHAEHDSPVARETWLRLAETGLHAFIASTAAYAAEAPPTCDLDQGTSEP